MPGANDVITVHVSGGQRSPHVRAAVVDRVIGSITQKNRDHSTIDEKGPAFPFGNRADLRDGLKFVFRLTFHNNLSTDHT